MRIFQFRKWFAIHSLSRDYDGTGWTMVVVELIEAGAEAEAAPINNEEVIIKSGQL